MPRFENEVQEFRHRGFEDVENKRTIMMFGNGPVPMDSNGVAHKKLWDNWVTQSIVSVHYADQDGHLHSPVDPRPSENTSVPVSDPLPVDPSQAV